MQPLYFGCYGDAGHYTFDTNMSHFGRRDDFLSKHDNDLIPSGPGARQSNAALHSYPEFAVLAMPDYSVDSRPGSNAMFLLRSDVTAEDVVEEARKHFPIIVARLEKAAPIKIVEQNRHT